MYTQSVFVCLFFNSRKGFYYFNSLPEKLIFKTLLWSLFITCATFKTRMPTKPSEME